MVILSKRVTCQCLRRWRHASHIAAIVQHGRNDTVVPWVLVDWYILAKKYRKQKENFNFDFFFSLTKVAKLSPSFARRHAVPFVAALSHVLRARSPDVGAAGTDVCDVDIYIFFVSKKIQFLNSLNSRLQSLFLAVSFEPRVVSK